MDPRPPFLRSVTDWISGEEQVGAVSVSYDGDIPAIPCSNRASIQRRLLPHGKDSGTPWEYQFSSLSTQAAFASFGSSGFSFTYHTIEFCVYNCQELPSVSCASSFQKHRGLQQHPGPAGKQCAMICSRHQCGAHDTGVRLTAWDGSGARIAFLPAGADGASNLFQFSLLSTMEVFSPRRAARQAACLWDPLSQIYVKSDIKSNSFGATERNRYMMCRKTAPGWMTADSTSSFVQKNVESVRMSFSSKDSLAIKECDLWL